VNSFVNCCTRDIRARDLPVMRKRLREMLQDYADLVMTTAPGGGT
jgi:hypothetical protein